MKTQPILLTLTFFSSLSFISCSSLQKNEITSSTELNCYSPIAAFSSQKKQKNRKPSSEEMNEDEIRAFAELKNAIDSNDLNELNELLRPSGLSRFLPRPLRRSPLSLTDNQGNTLLHWAVGNRNIDIEIIETLFEHGANLNAKNDNKQTPIFTFIKPLRGLQKNIIDTIHVVREEKEEEIIQISQQNEENPRRNHFFDSRADILRLLITMGADLGIKDKEGRTPLSLAAQYAHQPIIITILLEANPDLLEEKNYHGNTPLLIAVISQNRVTTKTLLEERANPDAENNKGETPLYFAVNFGVYPEITAELILYGATISEEIRPKLLNILPEEKIRELRQQRK